MITELHEQMLQAFKTWREEFNRWSTFNNSFSTAEALTDYVKKNEISYFQQSKFVDSLYIEYREIYKDLTEAIAKEMYIDNITVMPWYVKTSGQEGWIKTDDAYVDDLNFQIFEKNNFVAFYFDLEGE